MKAMNAVVAAYLMSLSTFAGACNDDQYEKCWSIGPYKDCACLYKLPVHESFYRTVNLCGVEITVNVITQVLCQTALTAIPAACTVGAAATAGSSCAVAAATAAGTCGVSITTLAKGGEKCIGKS